MPQRKRIRSFQQLKQPHLLDDETSGNGFQDEFMEQIVADEVQPLGRLPGRQLSIDEENQVVSIVEAFDEGILNKLSQRQRECFTDVIISGDTYEVVAARYHMTKSSVQTYIKRAAKIIRRYIEVRDGE